MNIQSENQFKPQAKKQLEIQQSTEQIDSIIRSFTCSQDPQIASQVTKVNTKNNSNVNSNKQIKQTFIKKAITTVNRVQIQTNNQKNGNEYQDISFSQLNNTRADQDQSNNNGQFFRQKRLVGVESSSQNTISEPKPQDVVIQNYIQIEASLDLSNQQNKDINLSNRLINEESFINYNIENQKEHKSDKISEVQCQQIDLKQKQKQNYIDYSSRDMLQDQSLQFDLSNIQRHLNPDTSMNNPILNVESFGSKEWSDEEDNQNHNNQNHNLRYRSNIVKKNTTSSSKGEQQHYLNSYISQTKLSQKDLNRNLDATVDNKFKVKQINYESDALSSDNSNPSNINQNVNSKSKDEKHQLQYFHKEKKFSLIQNIPVYFNKEPMKQCQIKVNKITQGIGSESSKKNKADDFDLDQDQYFNSNSSQNKNQDIFQIKLNIQEKEDYESVEISLEKFKKQIIKSKIYNSKSSDIPNFNFSDVDLPSINKNQKSNKFENLQNILYLRDTQDKKQYQFLRFQCFEECSLIFQEMLLSNLVFDRILIPSVIKKKIYFYKHEENDIYLLREVEDFFTVEDIIQYTGQISLGFKLFNQEQTLTLFLEILKVYNVFLNEKIALPNLSSQTIIISYNSLAVSFSSLQSCYSILNKDQNIENQIRQRERDQIINIFQNLSKKIFKDKSSVGIASSTMINDNESIDENKYIQFHEQLYNLIQKGNIQEAIFNIQNELQEIFKQNQHEGTILNNSLTFLEQQLLNANYYQNNYNNEKYNQKLVNQYKMKRLHFIHFINIFESQINSKQNIQEKSNFQKCQKLTYLYQIYESVFMKKEFLKTLEDLKNLKAECYGIDSNEYLKTLSILCKAYYNEKIHKLLLLNLEPYTNYLRNNLNPSNANDLFEITKFKLKMTNSPTVREDIQTLIDFLLQKQKLKDKCTQILPFMPTPQTPEPSNQELIFNLSILYYQLACSYKYVENNEKAMEYFQKCLNQIKIETDSTEKEKDKIYFYCQSNIARIYCRNKKIIEAKKILKSLESNSPRYMYPPFFQYLGQIEFEEKNYKLAYEYLNQCYILRYNDSKCNKDYLELLFYYILVTFKLYGSNSKDFRKLCQEIKNFTGDYYNLNCLLVITKILLEQHIYELALKKFEQAKGIMNLQIFSQNKNKTLYNEYKKKVQELEKQIEKMQTEIKLQQKASIIINY
ncbi:hypothetical protein TTHERM_00238870 (macronuclear) [Tetrahymena thermophila SB210]|uniref:Tetratricopeptide repeat protein n=1 Tax=Tetrahymena thermophila (strain SB210) TaxID=312017 RepID=I7MAG8_TETTS|nr:hypothetical protein TTHERM_00238870 [Tetrahymena thermophila SB210]EAS04567.2 hypothetical protein TTHERM_00238870 [Tetrahymena thermophila SB210]|eukprot:XP_001024812.2 hypothetical protein TTHERM_00238870 [Tetrahymena thermophila SB210]